MKKRLMSILLAASLVGSLAGCGGGKTEEGTETSKFPAGEVSYPIENAEDVTLTFWKPLNPGVSAVAASENEIQFSKWLKEETGINIEFIHPPIGQENEKFNLMLASGELPDIIQYAPSNTNEGAEKLVANGYIYELSEEFLNNYAPNFAKKLAENPELNKSAKMNNGKYYGFEHYRSDDSMTVYAGPIIRQDWLDDLGLAMPETMDEWHDVLTKFKTEKNADAPLTCIGLQPFNVGAFSGAFGTKLDYYTDNGKVKHGVLEPAAKDFITEMSQWYKEGLLDKDFASNSKEQTDIKMLTGKSGATYGLIGSGMGNLLSAAPDDKYALKAAPYPAKEKGQISEFGAKDSKYYEPQYMITATSKNKELAARFLDFGYSEKGGMFYNFGREGETYNMVDGFPTFSDLIYKNPDGLSTTQAFNMYTHCAYLGPTEFDVRFFKQQYQYQEQKDAIDVWSNTNAKNHMLVTYNADTPEEKSELSKYSDINTHINENIVKFIMGVRPIEEYDAFVQELKNMGMDKVIELKQTAHDRYQAR